MPRIVYVDGRYLAHGEAALPVEDRATQFADAVYEVCEVRDGRLIDESGHMARLSRSLAELRIAAPMPNGALGVVMREVVRRNRVRDGLVYLQVSRGSAPRNHAFPSPAVRPSLTVTAKPIDPAQSDARAEAGVSVITVPDNRWQRVDIKTTSLLPNVLAKQTAREAGAFEAWFVDADGRVTEGSSSNAWIVTADGDIVTPPADTGVLRGVTRTGILALAGKLGRRVTERRFTVAEAQAAREAFLSSATTIVMPIVAIDGRPVGNGAPGSTTLELRRLYHQHAERAPLWARG
ncbi:MAG: D-amino-acid transaminase [Bauldia sp.]